MPLVLPWKKMTCPFCFNEFHIGHAPIRNLYLDPVHDEKVREFLGYPEGTDIPMAPLENQNLPWYKRLYRCFYYPNLKRINRESFRYVCPHCHMELPTYLIREQRQSDIIAIAGYRVSGKSNFFGVLIPTLENRYSKEVGFSIYALDTFSTVKANLVFSGDLWSERYGQYLFNQKQPKVVPPTSPAQDNPDIRIPLLYRLTINKVAISWKQRLLHPFRFRRSIDLVIFDSAGEDMDNPITSAKFNRYIHRASGIIVLVDPTSIPQIRNGISKIRNEDNTPGIASMNPVENIIRGLERIEAKRNFAKKFKTPLAVALSKFDLLQGMEKLDPCVFNDHLHNKGFNTIDTQETSKAIQDMLEGYNANHLPTLVDGHFENYQYFGVSALGEQPNQMNLAQRELRPINIADPLLWILYQKGYLRDENDTFYNFIVKVCSFFNRKHS